MIKLKLSLALGLIFSFAAFAQDPVELFKSSFPTRALGSVDQQAFCYESPNGKGGFRDTVHQRLASTTKLFTTLAVLETMPLDQTWTTTVYIKGGRVHIQGSMDPWFEEEKIFALIKTLQSQRLTKITELSFDSKFFFTDTVLEEHTPTTPAIVMAALNRYFTKTGTFTARAKELLVTVKKSQTEQGMTALGLPTRGIATTKITFKEINPLEGEDGVTVQVHTSRPLQSILKSMNVMSKNTVAENLWQQSSAIRNPMAIFAAHGMRADKLTLYNGSGLPMDYLGNRKDNSATCQTMLTLLRELEKVIFAKNLKLEDIIAVGTDLGTFRNRFLTDTDLKEAISAKTGTLYHTVTLAGWVEGTNPVRFALLNQTEGTTTARNFQDSFLSNWLAGTTRPRDYDGFNIYPLERGFFE